MRHFRHGILAVTLATLAVVPGGKALAVPQTPPSSAPPVEPLKPNAAESDSATEVHSWALAPAYNDVDQGGNRSDFSYEIAPGAEVHDNLTVFNLGTVDLNFRIYATDAFNGADGTFSLLPGDKTPTDVATWVTLPVDHLSLPAKTQATMEVTIKVPATARPGDHAGAILASSEAQSEDTDGRTITLDRRTGSRLYVRVAGPLSPKLEVEKLATSYTAALNPLAGKADVTFRVQNVGNVRMGGRQSVTLSGPLGVAAKHKAPVNLPELLPGEGVTLHTTFAGAMATGLATGKVHLYPEPVGAGPSRSSSWHALAFAPPYSLVALMLCGWLVVRARRAYLRRNWPTGGRPYAG